MPRLKNTTNGGALTSIQRQAKPVLSKGALDSALELGTSDTFVTDMARPLPGESSRELSTSAESTVQVGSGSTVLTMSPLGYVEAGQPTITDADWSLLPSNVRAKYEASAEGQGCGRDAVVFAVCDFLVEAQSDYQEGPLDIALIYYADNFLV